MPNYNGVWSLVTQYQYAADWSADNVSPATLAAGGGGGRAVFEIGVLSSIVNTMEFTTILTGSTFTDFGDATVTSQARNSLSSDTRGVTGGGTNNTTNVMDYVTLASAGNSTDFGDLLAGNFGLAGLSSAHGGLA